MEKPDIREQVWSELRKVAKPDSRFHFNFAEFIADFDGSSQALDLLVSHKWYKDSEILFITPDNCLEELRFRALNDGKLILMTTYGIYRGFWLLDPRQIPENRREYALTLDGMEKFAVNLSLTEIRDRGLKVDFMITGTGAINTKGVRFGKGHGFFDLEWAMLFTVGAINSLTHTAAVVHDCQLLDQELKPEVFDTVCDLLCTPTRILEVPFVKKPTCGIVWDLLAPGMLETIPPLQELKSLSPNN